MDRIKETIHDYESLTAGRFYGNKQKQQLLDLVVSANMLFQKERDELHALTFSSEIEECDTETDCANGLLMASILNNAGYRKELLAQRKKVLVSLAAMDLWDNREEWLRYLHLGRNSCFNQLENAIYAYSTNAVERAATLLKPLAERCHPLSVKLLIVLNRILKDEKEETKYLILLKKIIEELYDDRVPLEVERRLIELTNTKSLDEVEKNLNIELVYFDGTSTMGF